MAYLLLLLAIVAEVAATSLLKTTHGFSRVVPTVGCLAAYALSIALLAQAVKEVPVGVAYALWAGLGTLAVLAIGVAFLDEAMTASKTAGVLLVVVGVTVLHLGEAH